MNCLHFPYGEFYHKYISHDHNRKEPQKIKTFHKRIPWVAVSFSWLWKPVHGILQDFEIDIFRIVLLPLPRKDLHTVLIPVSLLSHHPHHKVS